MRLISTMCVLALCVTIVACSSAHVRPTMPPVAADERYPPINLYINAGDFVTGHQARMLRYLGDSLRESGRFSRVDLARLRWPLTLEVDYSFTRKESAATFAGAMVAAASLMLLPAPIVEVHTYRFSLSEGTEVLKTFDYEHVLETSYSNFDPNNLENDRFASMDVIVARFFTELAASGVLPRMRDIKAGMEPKPSDI